MRARKVVPVEKILEAGFSVEEAHHWAVEAYKEKYLMVSRIRVKGNRWGFDAMIPGDIDFMAVTEKGIQWYNCVRAQKVCDKNCKDCEGYSKYAPGC